MGGERSEPWCVGVKASWEMTWTEWLKPVGTLQFAKFKLVVRALAHDDDSNRFRATREAGKSHSGSGAWIVSGMFRYLAGVVTALLVISGGALFSEVAASAQGADTPSLILPVCGLFLASVATFTGVYFGWRRDRREAHKFKLEIEKMQAEQSSAKKPE